MMNDEIVRASESATALASWLELAGLPNGNERSYVREELAPLVEHFRAAMTPLESHLSGSCRELIQRGLQEAATNHPRIKITADGRDCLTRGLALFCLEIREEISDG